MRRRVDAVIAVASWFSPAEREALHALGVPLAVVGGHVPGFPRVGIDDAAGARTAVRHLLLLGHRDVAMISGDPHDAFGRMTTSARRAGFEAALAEAGAPGRPDRVVCEPWGVTGGRRAMEQLLARRRLPTAVFAESDEMALGALQTLRRAGLAVPGRVSLIGFDDHEMAAGRRPHHGRPAGPPAGRAGRPAAGRGARRRHPRRRRGAAADPAGGPRQHRPAGPRCRGRLTAFSLASGRGRPPLAPGAAAACGHPAGRPAAGGAGPGPGAAGRRWRARRSPPGSSRCTSTSSSRSRPAVRRTGPTSRTLVRDLVGVVLDAAADRPLPLRVLDRRREVDPGWFQRSADGRLRLLRRPVRAARWPASATGWTTWPSSASPTCT